MGDILDTRFDGKEVELTDNRAKVGDDINIIAIDPTLRKLHIGVGWDLNAYDATALDLDISVFLLDKNGKTRVDEDFIFYNNLEVLNGAVRHMGDNRTGAGEGDDETIFIDLTGVPFDIQKIVFVLSLYRGEEKDQRLGQVQKGFLRLANQETGIELLRYEIDKDLEDKAATGMIVASINREGPKWHFTPIAEFIDGGLKAIATRYGCVIVDN
jgi:tellurium resistance protein TerD